MKELLLRSRESNPNKSGAMRCEQFIVLKYHHGRVTSYKINSAAKETRPDADKRCTSRSLTVHTKYISARGSN